MARPELVDFSDPEATELFDKRVQLATAQTLVLLDQLTGGGANTLIVAYALGVYEELQHARSAEFDAEGAAGYVATRARIRADFEAIFAAKPKLTPEIVAYAKEHGLLDYNVAREAMQAAAEARQHDRNVN